MVETLERMLENKHLLKHIQYETKQNKTPLDEWFLSFRVYQSPGELVRNPEAQVLVIR